MTLASGTSVGLSYVAEVTHGTTPNSPTMKTLRTTTRNINAQKGLLESAEVRSDRQISDVRHGFKSVGGSVGFELSLSAYDDWLEALLGSTFGGSATTGAMSLDSVVASSKFTRGTGSFVTDGFKVGDVVTAAGFSSPVNTQYIVTAVAALDLTVYPAPAANVTGGGDETIALTGKRLDCGSTLSTFTVEKRFTDITKYQVFTGVAINQASFSIKPEAIVGGTFDVVGMSFADMSGSSLGSPTAAPTNSPFAAFDGVALVNGASVAVITGIDFTVTNNRNVQPVVGSTTSPDVFDGQCKVEGTMTVFLESSSAFYGYFVNETEFSAQVKLRDPNGTDFMSFFFPRLKATGAAIDPPQEGPITISMPFKALVSSTHSTTLRIQRSNNS